MNRHIYLILLCFFASGCGGGFRFSKGPALAPLPLSDSAFISAVLLTPPEAVVSGWEYPVETLSYQTSSPEVGFPPLANEAGVGEEAPVFAYSAEAGNEVSPPSRKEVSFLKSEFLSAETSGVLAFEKKQVASHQKSTKPGEHLSGNEPASGALSAHKEADQASAENPAAAPLPETGPSLPTSELPEETNRPREALSQNGGMPVGPNLSLGAPSERAGAGVKTAAALKIFPSLLNEKVQDFISFFQGRAESFFSRSLARSQAYEEMMKRIFREKNLPEELFYLALIESGYNPTAFSPAKASGIWQFISQTAKRFGLRVDKWVDERRDPEKSTLAAAEYLKTLHDMFQCWDLATASYNAGEGKVLVAMKKARSDDFWEISKHRYLKPETKHYVPMFLAAMTIAKEPQKYGFSNIEYHPPLVYEKVAVPPSTSLALIAKAAEADFSEIRSLNPALLREKTPPNLPQFEVNLPPGKKEVFEKNFPALSRSSASKNTHRVRPGETLSHLAKKYQVNVQELCQANALTPKTLLKPGSILRIPQ